MPEMERKKMAREMEQWNLAVEKMVMYVVSFSFVPGTSTINLQYFDFDFYTQWNSSSEC